MPKQKECGPNMSAMRRCVARQHPGRPVHQMRVSAVLVGCRALVEASAARSAVRQQEDTELIINEPLTERMVKLWNIATQQEVATPPCAKSNCYPRRGGRCAKTSVTACS